MEDIFNDVTGPRSSQMRIQDFNYIIFELSVDAFIFFVSFYKFFYKNDFVCLLLVKHKAMATSMTSHRLRGNAKLEYILFLFLELDLLIYWRLIF